MTHRITWAVLLASVAASMLAPATARSATGTVIGELLATMPNPSPGSGDLFAIEVAGAPGRVLVSAKRKDAGALDDVGEVFLFDDQTGQLLRTITHPEPAEDDEFGYSISFVDDDILVGAYGNDFGASAAGSAYLFNGDTGALERTIRNPEPQVGAVFGFSVTETNDGYAIAAIGTERGGISVAGAVYVFDGATGNHQLTLDNPSPVGEDEFGYSLAAAGGRLAIGSRFDRPLSPGYRSGSVRVFDEDSGNLVYTLAPSHPKDLGEFGHSVAATADKIIVGAPMEDAAPFTRVGRVYVFDAITGALDYEIENPFPQDGDWFGWAVAVAGDNLLIGAPRDRDPAFRTGAAYMYDLQSGEMLTRIDNPNPGTNDEFGRSVAGTDVTAIIGAWMNNTTGTAYAFSAVPEPTTVPFDIKPGGDINPINLKSKGVLSAAILSTDDFNVSDINVSTVLFGDPLLLDANGTGVSPLRYSFQDVSHDGLLDLSLKFSTRDAVDYGALGPDTIEGLITGELFDGTLIEGLDSIRIVPPNGSNGSSGASGDSVQVSAAIPEPSALTLAACVLLGLAARRKRRA